MEPVASKAGPPQLPSVSFEWFVSADFGRILAVEQETFGLLFGTEHSE
jgi:hypothetical protein